jgi:alpha-galactosidase
MIRFKIHNNGSYDIYSNDTAVCGCYPGIDGQPFRATSVAIDQQSNITTICYRSSGPVVTLQFSLQDGTLCLASRLQNAAGARLFHPIWGAQRKCESIFRHGYNLGGPTVMQREPIAEDFVSYGMLALCSSTGHMIFRADDHRRFKHFYDVTNGSASLLGTLRCLSCGFSLEGVAGDDAAMPDILVFAADRLTQGLERAADAVGKAMGARHVQPPAYHWCSWYYHYASFSQKLLEETLDGLASISPPVPLQTIQIDAGYCTALGDWLDPNPYWPEGLQKAAQTITTAGYQPGIWIGPFMVGNRSKLAAEHPDWLLRDVTGQKITPLVCMGEPKLWNYGDVDYYVLDTSHPEAMEYLRGVFRKLRGWGFRLFKTDFMSWGMQDSATVLRHRPGRTSVEYFRDVLEMIREEIGEESCWLGCIAPYYPMIGFADIMRIAGDVGAIWQQEGHGPSGMIQEVPGENHQHIAYWQNDPDAMMLRDFHTTLTRREVESLSLLQTLSGGAVYTSDPLHLLSPDRLELFRFLQPTKEHMRPVLPYFGQDRAQLALVHKLERGYLLFFFNRNNHAVCESHDLAELTGEKMLYLTKWKDASPNQPSCGICVELAAHESALYFAGTKEAPEPNPENVWTWAQ